MQNIYFLGIGVGEEEKKKTPGEPGFGGEFL